MSEASNELTPLSERELEIVRLLATGATNLQIAQELIISVNTVKVHLRNIYAKLEVGSRTEATMLAVRMGWVDVPRTEEGEEPEPSGEQAAQERRTLPAPSVRPVPERWPPVPLFKRVTLVLATFLALFALFLPQVIGSDATEGTPDPIREVFPTATPASGSSSGRWRTRAQMPTPRSGLAVVVHDGKVYAIGGVDNEGATGEVEVYDPETDAWTIGVPKPLPAGFVTAALVEDQVAGTARFYVPGGIGEGEQPLDALEVYDPALDVWESRAPLPKALSAYALVSWDGSLYLFGGLTEEGYSDSVYRYDPEADRWEPRMPMEQARAFLGAAVVNDIVYVVGGFDGENELDVCDAYDPANDTWTPCSPMALQRGGLALVTVRGMVYAVGGGMDSYLAFNERYDPHNGTWGRLETPVMGQWRGLGLVYVKPDIYAIGGWSDGNLSVNEAYQALFVIVVP